jgi:cytochrome c556
MLVDYVEGAKSLEARMTGSSAEAKDMKLRFAALQATASAALAQIGNAGAVRAETKKVFGQCASCHDVYSN